MRRAEPLLFPGYSKVWYLHAIRRMGKNHAIGAIDRGSAKQRIEAYVAQAVGDENINVNDMSDISTTGLEVIAELEGVTS